MELEDLEREMKDSMYTEFRKYYRTYGDIGKFRRMKVEKYYCAKTHCYPIFKKENLVPIQLNDESLRNCELECSVYLKEFHNYFRKAYVNSKREIDECINKSNEKECKSTIFSKYINEIDEYANYLLE